MHAGPPVTTVMPLDGITGKVACHPVADAGVQVLLGKATRQANRPELAALFTRLARGIR